MKPPDIPVPIPILICIDLEIPARTPRQITVEYHLQRKDTYQLFFFGYKRVITAGSSKYIPACEAAY